MTTLEIKRRLGLPDRTPDARISSNALQQLAPGGAELLQLKQWLSGVANSARDHRGYELSVEALKRVGQVERAMLADLESHHELSPGSLTNFIRDGVPRPRFSP